MVSLTSGSSSFLPYFLRTSFIPSITPLISYFFNSLFCSSFTCYFPSSSSIISTFGFLFFSTFFFTFWFSLTKLISSSSFSLALGRYFFGGGLYISTFLSYTFSTFSIFSSYFCSSLGWLKSGTSSSPGVYYSSLFGDEA